MKEHMDNDPWFMAVIVTFLGMLMFLLREAGNGKPFKPPAVFLRVLAKAAFTGLAAAGLWSGISEFRHLNPTTGVAIAAAVVLLGVELLENLLERLAEIRLGLKEGKPRPHCWMLCRGCWSLPPSWCCSLSSAPGKTGVQHGCSASREQPSWGWPCS